MSGCGLLSWHDGGSRHSHNTQARSQPARSGARLSGDEYTVQRGDTLYSIAFRNQVDYHDLASWNGIGRDYTIFVGQRLRLTPPGSLKLPPPVASSAAQQPAVRTPVPVSPSSPSSPVPASPPAIAKLPDLPPEKPQDEGPVGMWRWPTEGSVVHEFAPDDGQKGIDIAARLGQPVYAAAAGKVVYSGSALKGYGELVIIKHNERYLSAYGYNSRRLVEEGQTVAAGQPIAEVGQGPTQQPMLHFEIRDKGTPINPLPLLPSR